MKRIDALPHKVREAGGLVRRTVDRVNAHGNRGAAQQVVVQRAAVQAAVQHHYHAPGRSIILRARPATLTVLARRTIPPEETSRSPLGLDLAESYLIGLTIVSEGVIQGEVISSDGVVLYSGTAESRVDSLLEMFATIDSHAPSPTYVDVPVEPTGEMQANLGLDVAEAYWIKFSDVGEGVFLAELISSGGEILCSGLGDDRSDGLQEIVLRLVDGEDPAR